MRLSSPASYAHRRELPRLRAPARAWLFWLVSTGRGLGDRRVPPSKNDATHPYAVERDGRGQNTS
jgi:hypothetical protein